MSEPAVSTRCITQFLVEHPVAVGYHLAEAAEGTAGGGPPTKPAYNDHCTICLNPDQTTGAGIPTIILHCGHRYHHACIEEWYSRCPAGHICPTCREPFRPSQQSGNSADDALTTTGGGKFVDAEGAVVDDDGTRRWHNSRGELHRDGDLPAVISANGDQEWWRGGGLHRDGDLPAAIRANGDRFWYQNGVLHRDGDLPAVISANGGQVWYRNGRCHRDGDRPAVVIANGGRMWYQNGRRHRDGDRPAVVKANGDQEYWQNGVQHRNWPAANYKIHSNGDLITAAYLISSSEQHRGGDPANNGGDPANNGGGA